MKNKLVQYKGCIQNLKYDGQFKDVVIYSRRYYIKTVF